MCYYINDSEYPASIHPVGAALMVVVAQLSIDGGYEIWRLWVRDLLRISVQG